MPEPGRAGPATTALRASRRARCRAAPSRRCPSRRASRGTRECPSNTLRYEGRSRSHSSGVRARAGADPRSLLEAALQRDVPDLDAPVVAELREPLAGLRGGRHGPGRGEVVPSVADAVDRRPPRARRRPARRRRPRSERARRPRRHPRRPPALEPRVDEEQQPARGRGSPAPGPRAAPPSRGRCRARRPMGTAASSPSIPSARAAASAPNTRTTGRPVSIPRDRPRTR